MKNYLLILLSVLGIGFLISSNIPESTVRSFDVVPEANQQIEANLLPEKETITKQDITEVSEVAKITTTPVVAKAATTPVTQNYTVTRANGTTVKNPGGDIYRTDKMVYAHNSPQLFGNLKYLNVGSIFTLTENGVTTSYQVKNIKFFKKINETTLYLCFNNDLNDCHGQNQIQYLVKNAKYLNENLTFSPIYSVVLMTCEGSGNTPYRRIIFANRI